MTHRTMLIAVLSSTGVLVVAGSPPLAATAVRHPVASAAATAGVGTESTLLATDTKRSRLFGKSVAVSGHTVVVDAVHHGNGGAGYVYVRPTAGWRSLRQVAVITPPQPAAIDSEVTNSVAISGDTIALSEPGMTVNGHVDQGAIYLYDKPATGWASTSHPSATLTVGDGRTLDLLGAAAVDGGTLVAGASGRQIGASVQGAAYVFTRPRAGWTTASAPAAVLTSKVGTTGDGFGDAVAIAGSTIAVTAPLQTVTTHPNAGAAYVYVKPSAGWRTATESRLLQVGHGVTGQMVGDGGIALGAGLVVVGASADTVGSAAKGSAYVFPEPKAGWAASTTITPARLIASDGNADDQFGGSVSASGRRVVIGSPDHTVSSRTQAGAGYLFTQPTGGWRSTGNSVEFSESSPSEDDQFGALAMTGSTTVAGASGRASNAGAAFVFAPPGPGLTKVTQSHRSWRLGKAGVRVNTVRHPKGGTVYRFSLDQAATVRFAFRKAGGFGFAGRAGANHVWFDGRIPHHKPLAAGHHVVRITASNANGTSRTAVLRFRTEP
jgi:hypothetical protein